MDTSIGLTAKQREQYSIGELIRAAALEDTRTLSFYQDCSKAISEKTEQVPITLRGILVPGDVLQRDLTAGSGASGGYLVDTPVVDFASALRAASLVEHLPLQRVSAKGNASVAVNTTAPTVTWLATEATAAADAAPTYGQVVGTPKTVSAVVWVSRHLMLQAEASMVEVERQLSEALAQAIDIAFVQGTGLSGQPTGLLNLSGTYSQAGASLAYTGVCEMIARAEGYGIGTPHVLLGVTTAKLLRQRAKISGGAAIFDGGSIEGLPTFVSRAVPDDVMVALCPQVAYDVRFGTLEVSVTPVSSPEAFRRGAIGIRVIASVDFLVAHPGTVAVAKNIT